jgi:hypothetical protein
MSLSRASVTGVTVLAALPALAHGEQIVVFPFSFVLLVIPALGLMIAPWHRKIVRFPLAALLLFANVAMWFLPPIPQSVGELAAYSMWKALAILVSVPIAVTAVGVFLAVRFAPPPVA